MSRQYGGDYSAESHTIKVDRAHNFFLEFFIVLITKKERY